MRNLDFHKVNFTAERKEAKSSFNQSIKRLKKTVACSSRGLKSPLKTVFQLNLEADNKNVKLPNARHSQLLKLKGFFLVSLLFDVQRYIKPV